VIGEFFIKYLWWIGWILITPMVLFCAVVYYIMKEFDKFKLNDIEWDEFEQDTIQ
jgi:hypothetical protein